MQVMGLIFVFEFKTKSAIKNYFARDERHKFPPCTPVAVDNSNEPKRWEAGVACAGL